MNLQHIYSSDAPDPKDHIITAHAVDALTSVSGFVRSTSRPQPKTSDIQSDIVGLLEPHLCKKIGEEKSRKIGPKESILVFSDKQGLLKQNNPLPKEPGRYTAIVPALPVDGSLPVSHPAIAAFQPHDLQTIFSPPKQDVDHASIQRQFSMLNETIVRLEQQILKLNKRIVEQDEKNLELDQKNLEQDQKILELNEDCHRYRFSAEQLQHLNTLKLGRIASLEVEKKGFEEISQHSAEWATLRDTKTVDCIRIRELINQAQARLARLANLPGATDDSYLTDISLMWRQKINSFGSESERIQYTTDIAGLAGPVVVSSQTIRELSSPTSALRTAGDQAAHPNSNPVFDALIQRAKNDQQPILRELVSFVTQ